MHPEKYGLCQRDGEKYSTWTRGQKNEGGNVGTNCVPAHFPACKVGPAAWLNFFSHLPLRSSPLPCPSALFTDLSSILSRDLRLHSVSNFSSQSKNNALKHSIQFPTERPSKSYTLPSAAFSLWATRTKRNLFLLLVVQWGS